jgi:hypothetical protein
MAPCGPVAEDWALVATPAPDEVEEGGVETREVEIREVEGRGPLQGGAQNATGAAQLGGSPWLAEKALFSSLPFCVVGLLREPPVSGSPPDAWSLFSAERFRPRSFELR